ncbi:barstar family protein [Lysobacter koreensis]|uniref:Barstar family protein n=1 Tax=Lysobacter koreensis TaxID=266122 RepID=A0ABW2YNH5_9GAMM
MTAVALQALLADAGQSGAFFVADSDSEAMAQAGAALEYEVVRIDLRGCVDKDEALARFARALGFPGWFGGNWDAFSDSLRDLSWLPAAGYLLLIEHAAAWRESEDARAGEDFDTALDILNEAASDWAERDVAFWALIPLPEDVLATLEAG